MPDPISLKSFTDIRTDRQIGVGNDGGLRETGSRKEFLGRLVDSWSRTDPQREEYKQATQSFVQALKSEYGDKVGDWAQRELETHLREGRPLTGHRVQEMVGKAKEMLQVDGHLDTLDYAGARFEDLRVGLGKQDDPQYKQDETREAMFPPGWKQQYLERFDTRLEELSKDTATPWPQLREKAMALAFDDVVLTNSKSHYDNKQHRDTDPVDPLRETRRAFLQPETPHSPEVQKALTEFYEKEILPLQEMIVGMAPSRSEDMPKLLELPVVLEELGQRFTGLRDSLTQKGVPTRETSRVKLQFDQLKDHLVDSTLAKLGLYHPERGKSSSLNTMLVTMGQLAREAQDPQRREEMFRDPQVLEQMTRLDQGLEEARLARHETPIVNERIDFLQGIVRHTAQLCSEAQRKVTQ